MRTPIAVSLLLGAGFLLATLQPLFATSNHEYRPGEYVTVDNGRSPNGRYAIATHGGGNLGYDNFHVYLMNGDTTKKIGPLEEIKETLDTGADAFYAKWSPDSGQVAIRYRIDRHVAMEVRYRIANHRAYLISGPAKVDGLRFDGAGPE